jgi:DASS family divalent anion:Na+ symporter
MGLVVVLCPTIILLLPVPAGVTPQAWRLLAIFVGTILGLMPNPAPRRWRLSASPRRAFTGALPAGQVFAGYAGRSCGWSSRRSASRAG